MRLPERLPARLPVVLFGVLAVATVGAFYLVQHLKTKNPLYNGAPRADPAVIDPRYAGVCLDANHQLVSFRHTRLAFYLQSRSDTVSVYVIDADGANVATMAGSGRHVRAGLNRYVYFSWNGRLADGQFAPAGTYTFRALFEHQGRLVPLTGVSVRVQAGRPAPRVSAITVNQATATTGTTTTPAATAAAPGTTTPVFTPGPQTITVHVDTARDLGAQILVYRSTAQQTLKLVKSFGFDPATRTAVWDGRINGEPAPAGTYLIGVSVTDGSCTSGHFPRVLDPAPGSTARSGVNISYLSADPPMDPVNAGALADVGVDSAGAPYHWALRLAGQAKVIYRGTNPGSSSMHVRLPGVGLYELTVVSGDQRTSVPLVASAVGQRAAAKVLVVLPALTWQGADATDDDGDGLIDTLSDGGQISLERPLVDGLPAGLADEASLLAYLDSQGLSYDLTTDIALAEGVGPSLTGRSGVLLDGTFTWLPAQLAAPLGAFARAGGGVFADGVDSLERKAQIADGNAGPIAGPSKPMARDPFGVTHAGVASSDGQLITELTDGLGIFGTIAALQFPSYQVLEPPGHRVASAAGVAQSAPAVIGFHLKQGTVVEAGLPDFGASLSSSVDARELLSRIWHVVLR